MIGRYGAAEVTVLLALVRFLRACASAVPETTRTVTDAWPRRRSWFSMTAYARSPARPTWSHYALLSIVFRHGCADPPCLVESSPAP
jgi:hypothetical protein